MLSFNTNVSVPKEVIRQIGTEIRERVMKGLLTDRVRELNDKQMYHVDNIVRDVLNQFISENQKSCDGWSLKPQIVWKIATYLREHKKIEAIKEFRKETITDLRTAKRIIDQYPLTNDGARKFEESFE